MENNLSLGKLQSFFDYLKESLSNRLNIDFKLDDDNISVIKALCLYHNNNEYFESLYPNMSLKKGILLFGPVGTGKTTIMHLFHDTPQCYTTVVNCRKISDDYALEGLSAITKYNSMRKLALGISAFNHYGSSFCFDDLGAESPTKHFSETRNVMADIIQNRYDNRLRFNNTHITTNLSSAQIEELYGLRVLDRMKEMFNLLTLTGKSRRS
ncbi:P-loop NTPase family protein [Parafilimonas terrae]|uniref:hypothetical protein n=1 Tax=Parafilimonas terrae TaxID=1465490 RepID=UPI0015A5088E|nr:hypothetical protein [Parafilimonas terrae]